MISSLVLLSALAHVAEAAPLEPQVRVHLGANYVGGPSPFGLSLGMDARLTRLVAVDFGAFLTPAQIPDDQFVEQAENSDYFHLRHGVYFAPGIRIPHPQPRTWAWEFFLRAGTGVVWFADTDPDAYSLDDAPYAVTAGIGGFGGADAFVRFGAHFGLRVAGRAWVYQGQHPQAADSAVLVQPQVSLEALWQF